MRELEENTPTARHSTGVAADSLGAGVLGTLRIFLSEGLRRPRENKSRGRRPAGRIVALAARSSSRAVTRSHVLISPGSGAVARGVMQLTCSAISNPGRQGGDQPMSLAPEPR